eukprot:3941844-Rhodomonas_salina.2
MCGCVDVYVCVCGAYLGSGHTQPHPHPTRSPHTCSTPPVRHSTTTTEHVNSAVQFRSRVWGLDSGLESGVWGLGSGVYGLGSRPHPALACASTARGGGREGEGEGGRGKRRAGSAEETQREDKGTRLH